MLMWDDAFLIVWRAPADPQLTFMKGASLLNPIRVSIFTKICVLIILLVAPVLGLYMYSNRASVNVVRDEVTSSSWNKLSFFSTQVEINIRQLAMYGLTLSQDQMITEYQQTELSTEQYDRIRARRIILDNLSLYNATSSWKNSISVYFPRTRDGLSSDESTVPFDAKALAKELKTVWTYIPDKKRFELYSVFPTTSAADLEKARIVTKVTFGESNLIQMLNQFKLGEKSDPFLYRPGTSDNPSIGGDAGLIANSSLQPGSVKELVGKLLADDFRSGGSRTVTIGGVVYLVNIVASPSLVGWYFIDYVPLEKTLAPITTSRNLFYASTGLLLIASLLASYLLYRNVQMPILSLLYGTHRIQLGDYSVRLKQRFNNEFDVLFRRFNTMAEQIQELIEKVFLEKIRLREATLKQLQSQINPHFLYNCLFFIKSMAKSGDTEAISAMALNLGEYYRHITRDEKQMTTVRDEMKLVTNYLNIQNLRTERIDFYVELPEELLDAEIPRLIVQPIVENAVIHGLLQTTGYGHLLIHGGCCESGMEVVVEDNGVGIPPERLEELSGKLENTLGEDIGCGTWNVHQRLRHLYGPQAGLTFEARPGGGVCVRIRWNPKADLDIQTRKGA